MINLEGVFVHRCTYLQKLNACLNQRTVVIYDLTKVLTVVRSLFAQLLCSWLFCCVFYIKCCFLRF